jgi:hypothetical protein
MGVVAVVVVFVMLVVCLLDGAETSADDGGA